MNYEWRITFDSGETCTVMSQSIIWALESDDVVKFYDTHPDAGQPLRVDRLEAK
ncbi:hypothetical protein FHT44_005065 [Mycolicibacterium sp. BK634]|uniref:hypothetical protein n=1 Tax=Mycolicibacterium sp. BK634 TaxID=2587099 RepID=UPI00160929B0|nr:hypothetical protein [Mycolicibacterium sp. BK634]MBB3752553.1 hypothetical protein [Mycolicibacterium sp. BK634]